MWLATRTVQKSSLRVGKGEKRTKGKEGKTFGDKVVMGMLRNMRQDGRIKEG